MKKILMLATYGDFFAAFETDNINILNEMGFSVDLCANWKNPKYNYKHAKLKGLNYKKIHIPFDRSPYALSNIKCLHQLNKLIKKERYYLIDCHNAVIGVYGRIAAKINKTPKIMYTAHGYQFFEGGEKKDWFLYYPIEKILSSITDTIIVINKEDFELTQKKFYTNQIVRIPGVGLETFKFNKNSKLRSEIRNKLSYTENDLVLLSVGEVSKRKNHIVVIEALNKLRNPNIYYYIVGQGSYTPDLKEKIYKYSLEKNVFLEGHKDNINQYIQMSDVFIFPSKREGLGIAALEAMAASKPVISSNVQGIKDYSKNEVTGYVLEPDDIDGFAEKINIFYRNKENIYFFGKSAKDIAKEFDISKVNAIMKRTYENLLIN